MKRERITIYTNLIESTVQASELVISLKEASGLTAVTAFLPSNFHVESNESGDPVIVDKGGERASFVHTRQRTGRLVIEKTPNMPRRSYCDIIDPRSNMKIMAYYTGDGARKRWTLEPLVESSPKPVYLPPYCKLIQMERSGRKYIQLPSNMPWSERIMEDGRKYAIQPEPELLTDFSGISYYDAPYIAIGPDGSSSSRRICYLAEAGDHYAPIIPDGPTITRIEDGRWQIDTLHYDEETGTSVWYRKFSRTAP